MRLLLFALIPLAMAGNASDAFGNSNHIARVDNASTIRGLAHWFGELTEEELNDLASAPFEVVFQRDDGQDALECRISISKILTGEFALESQDKPDPLPRSGLPWVWLGRGGNDTSESPKLPIPPNPAPWCLLMIGFGYLLRDMWEFAKKTKRGSPQ